MSMFHGRDSLLSWPGSHRSQLHRQSSKAEMALSLLTNPSKQHEAKTKLNDVTWVDNGRHGVAIA